MSVVPDVPPGPEDLKPDMRPPSVMMQIGELARHANVSHRTIHYYERLGLLQPTQREGAGYRYYDGTALRRLEKIAALKRLGLSLEDIAAVLDLFFEGANSIKGKKKIVEMLQAHLDKVDTQMTDLTAFKQDLQASIERLQRLIVDAEWR